MANGFAGRIASTAGAVVGGIAVIGIIALALNVGARTPDVADATPATSASPSAAVVGAVDPSPDATADATVVPTPTTAPTATPEPTPSPEPTARPTATPKPATPKPPTPKPATPKPTHDPKPEGTPVITTASGSFGQTLTVQGIKVRVDRTAPRPDALRCVTDDPDRQGWTDQISFDIRMTWPDAGDAEEPWVAVGAHPWNVLQFDGPSPFASGVDYVLTTCHKPGDSDKVMVEISPPGSPMILLRWFFD